MPNPLTEAEKRELDALNAELGSPQPAAPAAAAPAAPSGNPAPALGQGDADLAGVTSGALPVIADMAQGLTTELPGALVRGVGNAIHASAHGLANLMDERDTFAKAKAAAQGKDSVDIGQYTLQPALRGAAWLGGKISGLFEERKTVTGGLVEGVTQFAVGIVGAGKFIKLPEAVGVAGKVLKVGEMALKNGVAAATVFEGQQHKLSDLVEQYPALQNPVTEYLQSKPDDTESEGRFKNAIEGMVMGGVGDTLFLGIRALKLFKSGDTQGALAAAKQAELNMERLRLASEAEEAAKVPSTSTAVLPEGTVARPEPVAPKPLTVVERLQEAYAAETGGKYAESVSLDKIRARLPELSRAEVDEGLLSIIQGKQPEMRLGRIGDRKALTPEHEAAAFSPGGEPSHLLWIKSAPKKVEAAAVEPKPVEAGIPAAEVPPAAAAAEHPAPYGEDIRTGAVAADTSPAKLTNILPPITQADAVAVQKALDARFAVAGELMATEGGRFNFKTLNGPEDLLAALNATTGAIERKMDKFVGGNKAGVETHEVVLRKSAEFADLVGSNGNDLINVMAHDAKTVRHLSARLDAYKKFMLSAVNDASEWASKALALEGTPGGVKASEEALHSAHIAAVIVATTKGIETGVARTMGAQRLTKGLNSKLTEGWGYGQIAAELEAGVFKGDDKKLLTALASMKDNPKGFNKYIEHTFGEKAQGAFVSWYMNALLSSPKTHIANFVSNTASTLYHPMERAVAGAVTSGVGPGKAWTRMIDEYHGMGSGLMDSFQAARAAFKMGQSKLDPTGGSHLDPLGRNVDGLSARALGLTHDYYTPTGELVRTEHTPVLSMFADGFSNAVGMPSRLLTTGDELFKQINYRGYLYSRAAEQARTQNLSGDAFHNFVSAEMDRGFNAKGSNFPEGSANNKEGLKVAREATFTQPLDYGISRWLQGMTNEPGMGGVLTKLVVPFVRTPVNLLRFAWKHTPLIQYAEQGFRRDLHAGGEATARAQAQIVTGMGMYLTAGYLAYSGAITGGFSLNPEIRKAEEATGKKEYALRVGDNYYQFNRMDPFGTILGLAADFNGLTSHLSQGEIDHVAYGMSVALAKNLASKTYLQGLTNAFASVGDILSGKSTNGFDTFSYRLAGSVVVPSVVNAFKGDETLREIRSVMDSLRSRAPGASKEVPPVHNVLGEVVPQPTAWGPSAFSPIGMGTSKNDVVYNELARQMTKSDHPLNRIMPKLGDTAIDLREVKLKSGQNAYDRMQELLWKSGVKESLEREYKSPSYAALHDGSIDYPMASGTKMWLTNKILENHKQIARGRLLAENPELLDLYNKERERMMVTGVVGDTPRAYVHPTFLQSILPGPSPKNQLK